MEATILSILSQVRPEFNFENHNNYISEGLLDSFDIVQLVDILDSEFNISIDGTDIVAENFSTMEDIISLVNKNKGGS